MPHLHPRRRQERAVPPGPGAAAQPEDELAGPPRQVVHQTGEEEVGARPGKALADACREADVVVVLWHVAVALRRCHADPPQQPAVQQRVAQSERQWAGAVRRHHAADEQDLAELVRVEGQRSAAVAVHQPARVLVGTHARLRHRRAVGKGRVARVQAVDDEANTKGEQRPEAACRKDEVGDAERDGSEQLTQHGRHRRGLVFDVRFQGLRQHGFHGALLLQGRIDGAVELCPSR